MEAVSSFSISQVDYHDGASPELLLTSFLTLYSWIDALDQTNNSEDTY